MNSLNFSPTPFEVRENFDLNKSCRVCLSQDMSMSLIFDEKTRIIDKIEFCTGVLMKEEEGLPTQICITCLKNLSIAHKFKSLCLFSEEVFQKFLLDRVKTEPINTEEYTGINYINTGIKVEIQNEEEVVEKCVKKQQKEKNQRVTKQTKPNAKQPSTAQNRGIKKKFKFRRLYCEICSIKFNSKEESDTHKKDVHSDNSNWICEFCGKVFLRYGSLYSHVRCHRPRRYQCAHCDYGCAIKHDLAKHLRIHFGIKKYKCSSCGNCFHTSSNLRDHERRSHGAARVHPCALCERRFHDRTKLARHVDSHYQLKRFSCDICGSNFTRRCYWKKHLAKQHNIILPPQRPGRQRAGLSLDHEK